ncbi:hypothetical protein NDU88_001091 [Pleurodeles waltl]|uniref:Uncharacterized protein n=1 Tax=Pleurodeles waltl TaxID=8319 RepID=A0AAV7MTQ9_PLEWA|nr:hypothetical protein NDU88_001091 [Pleurodeles waltl]
MQAMTGLSPFIIMHSREPSTNNNWWWLQELDCKVVWSEETVKENISRGMLTYKKYYDEEHSVKEMFSTKDDGVKLPKKVQKGNSRFSDMSVMEEVSTNLKVSEIGRKAMHRDYHIGRKMTESEELQFDEKSEEDAVLVALEDNCGGGAENNGAVMNYIPSGGDLHSFEGQSESMSEFVVAVVHPAWLKVYVKE